MRLCWLTDLPSSTTQLGDGVLICDCGGGTVVSPGSSILVFHSLQELGYNELLHH